MPEHLLAESGDLTWQGVLTLGAAGLVFTALTAGLIWACVRIWRSKHSRQRPVFTQVTWPGWTNLPKHGQPDLPGRWDNGRRWP